MKKSLSCLLAVLLAAALMAGCQGQGDASVPAPTPSSSQPAPQSAPAASASGVPDTGAILTSYYAAQELPAFTYAQNNSIRRFMDGWAEADAGARDPVWHYESFAELAVLDLDLQPLTRPGQQVYSLTYTDGDGQYGYIIFQYNEEDPSVDKWSLSGTDRPFDLRENLEVITASLAKTDIDLASATARRVSLQDTEHNRGQGQFILFTDGKGDNYLCDLSDAAFAVEKQ